jgi:hypothetical protein
MSRPVMGPTQPPIQEVAGALSLGVKLPGSEADHSPPSYKGKVKSLCLTKHHAMKTYWGNGGIAPLILDLGRWVGPRAVLAAAVKRKIASSCRESDPRTPIVQPIAQRYTG